MTWYALEDMSGGEDYKEIGDLQGGLLVFPTLEEAQVASRYYWHEHEMLDLRPTPLVEPDEPITDEWLAGISLGDGHTEIVRHETDSWSIVQFTNEVYIPTPTGKQALLALLAGLGIEQKGGS